MHHCRFSLFVRFSLILAACFYILHAFPVSAQPINGRSAILMDVTSGRILYEQRPDLRIPPASLTKVLSMYVALNAINKGKISFSDKVKISPHAAATGGSRLGLRSGERVTVDKLFHGMAVASGNDASVAIAEHVAGSTAGFVHQMNALAQRLGMRNSRFVNVHGLPAEGQYTTARDMLRLARAYQAQYPRTRKYHLAPSVTHNGRTEPNHNPLVGNYPGIEGLKTGWVTAAGYNIIVSAQQNGHRLIGVILGAPNTGIRAAEARRLLNAGFSAVNKSSPSAAAALGVNKKQMAELKHSPTASSAARKHPKRAAGKLPSKKQNTLPASPQQRKANNADKMQRPQASHK